MKIYESLKTMQSVSKGVLITTTVASCVYVFVSLNKFSHQDFNVRAQNLKCVYAAVLKKTNNKML